MKIEEMAKSISDFCRTQKGCNPACPLMPKDVCYMLSPEITNEERIAIEENYYFLSENGFFDSKADESVNDPVNHPSHYTQGGIECIDAMESAFGKDELAIYCKIAAFKYIWRCEHKNGTEDIDKAVWYLSKYLELKKGENNAE